MENGYKTTREGDTRWGEADHGEALKQGLQSGEHTPRYINLFDSPFPALLADAAGQVLRDQAPSFSTM